MGCTHSSVVSKVKPSDDDAVNKYQFNIERVIGQGGFGKVNAVVKCKGHDKGTWYAMKTLQKAVILERNHVAMVMKERNLLARLHCPQLVNMHYSFQDEKHLFIIMDVCLGGDLHYQLTHNPLRCFGEEQARFYAASIVLCLDYMHGVGVMHRDVKPENLLLDKRGQLKVTDLGISMEVVDGHCTSTSGTRPYMAPEIFMTGHQHTYVADFYALGITIYQFLMGQRPYKPDAANMKAIVRMATFIPPDKYTDVKQIRRILMSAQERKAPSPEFKYATKLAKFSAEARDFVQSLLICNPKYRLGSQGIAELMRHPWMDGIDWEAMRRQEIVAPFVPDTRQANCSITDADAAAMVLSEEESDKATVIPPAEQSKFTGFDYRTLVKDNFSGRTDRIIRHSTSLVSGPGTMYSERVPTISVTQSHEVLSSSFYSSNRVPSSGVSDPGSGIVFPPRVQPTTSPTVVAVASGDPQRTPPSSDGVVVVAPARSPVNSGGVGAPFEASGLGATQYQRKPVSDIAGVMGVATTGATALLFGVDASEGSSSGHSAHIPVSPANRSVSHATVGLPTPGANSSTTHAFGFDEERRNSAAAQMVTPVSGSGRRFSYSGSPASNSDNNGVPAAMPASQVGRWLVKATSSQVISGPRIPSPDMTAGSGGSGGGGGGGGYPPPPTLLGPLSVGGGLRHRSMKSGIIVDGPPDAGYEGVGAEAGALYANSRQVQIPGALPPRSPPSRGELLSFCPGVPQPLAASSDDGKGAWTSGKVADGPAT